jgi:internalin A
MKELVTKLPEIDVSEKLSAVTAGSSQEEVEPRAAQGASLRAVRALLDEKDSQQYWGGLKRVLTPEGHYLWLCEHHASPYAR